MARTVTERTPQTSNDVVTVHDFDAWWDENIAKTTRIRLLGQEWDLPLDAPAAAVLRIQRIEQAVITATDTGAEPSPELTAELAELSYESMVRSMVGDALVEAWLDAGISVRQLQRLSGRLYAFYTGQTSLAGLLESLSHATSDAK